VNTALVARFDAARRNAASGASTRDHLHAPRLRRRAD